MPKLLKKSVVTDEVPRKLLKRSAPVSEPIRPPLVKGAVDQVFPDCVLVRYDKAPVHPWFPKLNPRYVFKETYFRYDRKQKKVRCLVTVMADGLRVAWDNCQYCHRYFTMCSCNAGIQTCRSIEYIHDSIEARMKGEEWGVTHPNYRGSLTRKEREERAASPQRFVMPDRPSTPVPAPARPAQGSTGPGKKLLRRAVVPAPPSPVRKLLKKSTEDDVATAVERVDIDAMAGAAEEMIEAMTRQLGNGTKKVLKKSGPAKKLIRRG